MVDFIDYKDMFFNSSQIFLILNQNDTTAENVFAITSYNANNNSVGTARRLFRQHFETRDSPEGKVKFKTTIPIFLVINNN